MKSQKAKTYEKVVFDGVELGKLIDALRRHEYDVVGPTVRDGAIVYDELNSEASLPAGWTDEQGRATYQLKKRGDKAFFGYVVGPQSWKKYLHPPILRLWQAKRKGKSFEIVSENGSAKKYAFVGVRACELQAIAIQDRVFLQGQFVDPNYQLRRRNLFVVAVNCAVAGGNCFCASMHSGPKATSGFDLALTEILYKESHYFVVEIGTTAGQEILNEISYRPATDEDVALAEAIVARTAENMGRQVNATNLKELFYKNYDNAAWEAIATRCMSCANCTMVCPTCFCTTVEDVTDLTGTVAERIRKWDSCFTMDFSYIHGGSIRITPKSRYRQWLTHKFATWIDQFGTSGCVGCGRCISWCPVGIDITEEVNSLHTNAKE